MGFKRRTLYLLVFQILSENFLNEVKTLRESWVKYEEHERTHRNNLRKFEKLEQSQVEIGPEKVIGDCFLE